MLAAMITAPQNERFAQVIANRVWARFMGRGIVEPVEDWEKGKPTHPELLKWKERVLNRDIDLAEIDTTAFTDRYGGTMKGIAPTTQAVPEGVRAAE